MKTKDSKDAASLRGAQQGPVRTEPFHSSCYVSGQEEALLLECLRSHQWSSFKGGTEGLDIDKVLVMPSREAAEYGPLDNRFLGGKYVRAFERDFAACMDVDFAVSANSATSALIMALGAFNLEPGDEVIVPCMSFNATATAVLAYNCIPVFAEVKANTYCLDPADLEKKISGRTKAVLVVHLGGACADMTSIVEVARRHGLKILEDCAQAPGVKFQGQPVGTFGDAGVFSLTETKNITCGEGGVLVTRCPDIAAKARLIRNHGEGVTRDQWSDGQLANVIGMNFRLTELQAAVAIPQLQSLEERNEVRRRNTSYLIDRLRKHPCLIPPETEPGGDYVCFMLKWRYVQGDLPLTRDEVVAGLQAQGIPIIKGYGRMMHENLIFTRKIAYGRQGFLFIAPWFDEKRVRYGSGTQPVSEDLNKQFIWFKYVNHPNTQDDMDDVVRAFDKVLV